MKKSGAFSIYLLIFGIIVTLGFCLDRYIGIYRQTIVGTLLLVIGFLFFDKSKISSVKKQGSTSMLAGSVLLACLLLLALSLRLLVTQFLTETMLYHSEISFLLRILLTVVVPIVILMILLPIVEKLSALRHPAIEMLVVGICFVPFCTHVLYIPSTFVFGCGCYWLRRCCTGSYRPEIFISYYLVMLFYDTLSISIGSIDFNLSLSMAISFLLFAVSVIVVGVYFALRVIKGHKFYISEFLTVVLVASIILLIGFAL